ncbi:MAG: phosphoglucosamine mutase [Elusimicrobia bacterium]|nr:phosphoglucosamine mutase [Elusimicrobiota bacterium]
MSRERLFGTDGVRGIPGKPPLTPDTVRAIGALAAELMLRQPGRRVNGGAPFVLMARDTRGSGPAIGRQLAQGFASAGCRTVDLGVIPTGAISYLVPRKHALCGVVVSASHNPAEFNGIKFFTAGGFKMDSSSEDRIERRLKSSRRAAYPKPLCEDGRAWGDDFADFLRSTFPATLDLSGMRLVVDCANGAASRIAPELFAGLGARVFPIGCRPNGRNINAGCGAMHPDGLRREVVRRRADGGVCFDGDADRALFCDEKGVLLDGDALICLAAVRLHRLGLLRDDRVVLTVMSNFGIVAGLKEQGIGVVSVPVGDRNVTEAIEKEGLSLGGENSGHIVFRQYLATGDGLLTAVQTLAALRESGRPLSWHREHLKTVPQVLHNLRISRKVPLERLSRLRGLAARCERELKGRGRVFLRYSGTEPLLRIMIEGPSRARIIAMARQLEKAFLQETGQEGSLK